MSALTAPAVARLNALAAPADAWVLRHRTAFSRVLLAANLVPLALLPFAPFQKLLGNWAWALLLVLLFVSPLFKISGLRSLGVLLSFRKELGILMGTCGVAHAAGYFLMPGVDLPTSAAFWWSNGLPTFLAWGAAALVVAIPLWLTSNAWAVRLLGKKWKWLHRCAYALLLLTALHVAFAKYAFVGTFAWVGAYAALKAADWWGVRLAK